MKTVCRKFMYLLLVLGLAFIIAISCKKDDSNNSSGTVTDADGNVYHTVTIGTQVWMVENLKTTHYNDASKTPITNVTDNTAWIGLSAAAYCLYNNDMSNKTTYGALYNWYAASDSRLCPQGWHVPTDAEWATLITFLGGDTLAGGKLKEEGMVHWVSPNTGADNSSGFTALPGGSHFTNGSFYLFGKYGWWWSTTESSTTEAWHECLQYNSGIASRISGSKKIGFSVRCVKDN